MGAVDFSPCWFSARHDVSRINNYIGFSDKTIDKFVLTETTRSYGTITQFDEEECDSMVH